MLFFCNLHSLPLKIFTHGKKAQHSNGEKDLFHQRWSRLGVNESETNKHIYVHIHSRIVQHTHTHHTHHTHHRPQVRFRHFRVDNAQ